MFPASAVPVLGLTGPTGAGKSAAARLLAALGCRVIDCDALAREVVRPGSPVLAALAQAFGADVLAGDGSLRRALLAQRAFADADARETLNRLTHPAIGALAVERAGQAPPDCPAIVLDAAALPESALAQVCDHIAVITAPEALRLRRIMLRDGAGESAARQRIEAQRMIAYNAMPEKTSFLENGSDAPAALLPQLKEVLLLAKEHAARG
ncbi:MAG: dephospho-CoA kinase [Oscillospiraceae bacterium]|jgi:dephospho-CoA kinase|nr:dephospho-CoA kinase [Oscillospiraceae bacterium]